MPNEAESQTVRPALVRQMVGKASLPVSLVIAAPALVALGASDTSFATRAAIPAAVFALVWLLFRGGALPAPRRSEVRVVAVLFFLVVPLAMALPLSTYARLTRFDAVFEALSALTTTGLSMMTPDGAAPALLFARAWLGWIGGLVIVLLVVAVLTTPDANALGLADGDADREDRASARRDAMRASCAYVALTTLLAVALTLTGLAPLRALVYAFGAVATFGASPDAGGVATLPPAAQVLVTIGSIAGATPLLWLGFGLRGSAARLARRQVIVGLVVAVVVAALLVRAMGYFGDRPLDERLWHGALLAFSAQTTSGFATTPIVALDQGSKLALCLAMIVGGAAGSTAGGFKTARLSIAFAALRRWVLSSSLARRSVVELRVAGAPIGDDVVRRVLVVGLLFAVTILLSWLPFVLRGHSPLDALVEVVGATTTCGFTTGITSPSLAPHLKLVLMLDMLLGRFEFLAVLVAIHPGTWLANWRERALRVLDARMET